METLSRPSQRVPAPQSSSSIARLVARSPSKFCVPDANGVTDAGVLFTDAERIKRARKLIAFKDQYTPRAILEAEGRQVPYDEGFTVIQPQ